MDVMGIIAVLVNCALIGLSGQVHRMFPEMSTTQTILFIVALEVIKFINYCYVVFFKIKINYSVKISFSMNMWLIFGKFLALSACDVDPEIACD